MVYDVLSKWGMRVDAGENDRGLSSNSNIRMNVRLCRSIGVYTITVVYRS